MATSISDLPFEEEENDLKTDNYVNGLVEFIRNAQTPLTIALQGEWGSGKTSLMTRLKRALCQGTNPEFEDISINTWEYSMLVSPEETVYNILGKLVNDISKNNPGTKKTLKKFLRGTGRFIYRGGRELLKAVPVANSTIGWAIEALKVPVENPFGSDNDDHANLTELRESLEEAIQQRKKDGQNNRILIFVDDLDRLNPPVAVEILELLKNVFTIKDCIFVLAIDYEVVVKGLEPKFGKLTNQNEREFRSFFDKIIQVPFSLPISSYKPMKFVLKSLKAIKYLKDSDEFTDNQKKSFKDVVEASVGNNPRSIKRLINTLSLLECIAKCNTTNDNAQENIDEKLLKFIIVAIQICYPRINAILVHNPNFTEWNREFAIREGINTESINDDGDWMEILEAVCSSDKYLSQRFLDISKLFSMMINIVDVNNENGVDGIGERLKVILDQTSVTEVSASAKVEDFDKKSFIRKLYENVGTRIGQLRPDIERIQPKNNTGNGGFKFWTSDGKGYDIRFIPSYNNDTRDVTLSIEMSTRIMRSENLLGKNLDEMLKNEMLAKALVDFDTKISSALQTISCFASRHSKDDNTQFLSYSEELRYLHDKGYMSGDVTHNAEYRITRPMQSDFQENEIVDLIADMVIANFDFRNSVSSLKF